MEEEVKVYQTTFNPETLEILSRNDITERFKDQVIGTKELISELEFKKAALNGEEGNTYYDVVGIDYSSLNNIPDDLEKYIPVSSDEWSENTESLNDILRNHKKETFNKLKDSETTFEDIQKINADYAHKYYGFNDYTIGLIDEKEKFEVIHSSINNLDSDYLNSFEIGEYNNIFEREWKANGFSYDPNSDDLVFGGDCKDGSGTMFHLKDILNEIEKTQNADRHNYMMLGRLESDCKYFLGNGFANEKHLWATTLEDHIKEMEKLYNDIKYKPEWISMEDIQNYKKDMCEFKLEVEGDNPNFITEENISFYYEFMSDKELIKNKDILPTFAIRKANITSELTKHIEDRYKKVDLQDDIKKFFYLSNNDKEDPYKVLSQSFFGIKDRLKPIDDYIIEIKESPVYKKHELNKEQNNKLLSNALDMCSIDELTVGDMWTSIEYNGYEHGLYMQFESKELDNGIYSDDTYCVYAYKNTGLDKEGYMQTNYSDTEFMFEFTKNDLYQLNNEKIYNKIQNNETIPASEYSKVDFESEAFKSLPAEKQESISNYIAAESDKTIQEELKNIEKNKEVSTSDLSL